MAEQKDKTYMPAGVGGLIRYQEEEDQLIKIKPEHLAYAVLAVSIIIILLHIF